MINKIHPSPTQTHHKSRSIRRLLKNGHLDFITIEYGATSHEDNIVGIGNPTTASIDPSQDGTTM